MARIGHVPDPSHCYIASAQPSARPYRRAAAQGTRNQSWRPAPSPPTHGCRAFNGPDPPIGGIVFRHPHVEQAFQFSIMLGAGAERRFQRWSASGPSKFFDVSPQLQARNSSSMPTPSHARRRRSGRRTTGRWPRCNQPSRGHVGPQNRCGEFLCAATIKMSETAGPVRSSPRSMASTLVSFWPT
jgi:hypothetical protein